VLETPDGECIFESNAIARFLASSARSTLYPPAAVTRARIDAWMDAFNTLDCIGPLWFYPIVTLDPKTLNPKP
jgi:alanyl-tRNA synthetase/elongation factor 1-gamma